MKATKQQVKDFVEGFVWQDIKEILEDWIDGIKTEVFAADDIDEVRRYQGRMEALEYFLALPSTLIEALEFEEKEREDGTRHDSTG